MIIGINGYSGSGKDTIGIIIQYLNCANVGNLTIEDVCKEYKDHEWWLEDQSGWEIRKFAGKLKDIASHITGIDIEKFEDQEFKKTNMGLEWSDRGMPITVRKFLQLLGTDALRNNLHYNVWVNALFSDYVGEKTCDCKKECRCLLEYPNWIITDTRFINEANAIKNKGGIIIRVDRPGVEPINNHASENQLDTWKFDYRIVNNGDLFALKFNVLEILKHAKQNIKLNKPSVV
jgi:hypothetical protein